MRGLYFLLPCASWSLYVWPGTSSLQYGYNILKGSPASGGADPGWSSKAFSNPNCDSCFVGGSTIDGGYSVPAGISVSHSSYCAYNSSTITVQDAASWSQAGASSIAPNPDYPGPFGGLYYSSSASTQRVSTLTTNGMASLMVAAGECDTHTISLDAGHYTWQLSQDILEGLQSLPPLSPTPAVQQAYATFVESFGTHVPDSVTLGAYAVQETLFTAASFSLLQSASDSLAATASLSLLVFFGASLSSADTRAQSDYLLFAASLSSNTTACRPACPPVSPSTSYDPGQWAATLGYPPPGGPPNTNTTATLIAPAPVRATLIPITTALLSSLRGMEAAAAAAGAASPHPSGLSTTALATALRATQDLESFLNTSYCALLPACSPPTTSPHLALAPLPLLPTGLSAPAAAVLGGVGESAVLLIAGGEVGCTSGSSTTPPLASPATYLADLSQPGGGWTRKDDMPLGMGVAYGANIPVNATTVLIAGGWSGSSRPGTPSNSTLFFNVDSGAWSSQNGGLGVGGARAGAAWAVFGGVLVLLGGTQDGISPTNTTACVSLSTGLNQACPPSLPPLLPTPLVGGAAITIPSPFTPGAEMLVIAGGCPTWAGTFPFAAPTSCPTPSAAVFYAESTGTGGAWHTLSPLPQPAVGLALLVEHAPSSSSSSSSQYIGAAAPSQLPNFGGGGGEGGGVTALWALGGDGVARFLFDLGGWQPLPWSDPWSAGFGAMVQQQQGEGGELWRLGGCNASGSLPLIVEVTGGLSLN